MQRTLTTVLFCSLMLPTFAHAGEAIYRWTDDTGKIHYTAFPPAKGTEYELLRGTVTKNSSTTTSEDETSVSAPMSQERQRMEDERKQAEEAHKEEQRKALQAEQEELVRGYERAKIEFAGAVDEYRRASSTRTGSDINYAVYRQKIDRMYENVQTKRLKMKLIEEKVNNVQMRMRELETQSSSEN